MTTVGTIPKYRLVPHWAEERDAPEWASDVVVDDDDLVYVFARKEPMVHVYGPTGELLSTWGKDLFLGRPHGIALDGEGFLYCIEDVGSTIHKCTRAGRRVGFIGPTGDREGSNDEWDWKKKALLVPEASILTRITEIEPQGGPPFNRPTGAVVASNGDIYVADGYRNCKVHRFSHEGELLQSWGRSGSGPGEFHLLHAITVHRDRVYVTDRENERIQVFDLEGSFVAEWTNVQRPHCVHAGPDGLIFVAEARVKIGRWTFRRGVAEEDLPRRISIRDENGTILDELTGEGLVGDPHGFTFDRDANLFVIASRKLEKYERV